MSKEERKGEREGGREGGRKAHMQCLTTLPLHSLSWYLPSLVAGVQNLHVETVNCLGLYLNLKGSYVWPIGS